MFGPAALAQIRRSSQASMPDAALVTAPALVDDRPIDPESGQPIGPPPRDTLYSGPCSVTQDRHAVVRDAGGDADVAGEGFVRLPRVSASFEARLEAAAGTFTFGPATNRVVRSGRPLRVLRGRTADWLVVTWDTIAEETP